MLAKTLKTRHLNMIALGGSIGTGMFLTTGVAINQAGAGGALLAYLIISVMVFFLITSLGELSTHLPSTGSFCEYAGLFVSKPYGSAMGINYWFNWAITIAAEISAAVIIFKFWFPQASDLLCSAIFFVAILCLNVFSVRVYGEIEFVLSTIKIAVIVIFIILGGVLIIQTPHHGLNNFNEMGRVFNHGISGFLMVFLVAGFSFQGSELIGVTSGEAQSPSTSIPKAVKKVFWRLFLFYILGTLIISLLVPHNLLSDNGTVVTSPFTLVFSHYINSNIAVNLINFVILIAVLSAANASMYSATRTLWYMSVTHQVSRVFSRTTSYGLPIYSLLITALIGSVVLLSSYFGAGVLFNHLINVSSSCGFIAWFGIALSHYMFRKSYIKDLSVLKYKAIWFPFGPIFSMILITVIILGQGYTLWDHFSGSGFFDAYGALIMFGVYMLYYKFGYNNKQIILGQTK